MAGEFSLRSAEDGASLSLAWDSSDYWMAVLTGPGVTARRRVYAYAPLGHFGALFTEMAREWRGWAGEKRWQSLESELKLSCTTDLLGHVSISVELVTDNRYEWRARGLIVVEAGQLDRLAKEARAFLDDGLPRPM